MQKLIQQIASGLGVREEKSFSGKIDIGAFLEELERILRREQFEVEADYDTTLGVLTAYKDAFWRSILGLAYHFSLNIQQEENGTTVTITTSEFIKRISSGAMGRYLIGPLGLLPPVAGQIFQQNLLSRVWTLTEKHALLALKQSRKPDKLLFSTISTQSDKGFCFYSNCGGTISPEDKFCRKCGRLLLCPQCERQRTSAQDIFCAQCGCSFPP